MIQSLLKHELLIEHLLENFPGIEKYLGIQFAWQGRSMLTGFDCVGLIVLFYKQEYGIEIEAVDDKGKRDYPKKYEKHPDDRLGNFLLGLGPYRKIPHKGDIIMFGEKEVVHCGIFLGDGVFLNQCRKNKDMEQSGHCHIAFLGDSCWFPGYRGAIRMKGVDKDGRPQKTV